MNTTERSLPLLSSRYKEWEAEYGVESPSELLAAVADTDLPEETNTHREIACEWEHLADRLPIVKTALKEYDWATDRDAIPA